MSTPVFRMIMMRIADDIIMELLQTYLPRANMRAWERYGVDLVMCTLIMVQLAARHFDSKKVITWTPQGDSILTRKGLQIKHECFKNIHL